MNLICIMHINPSATIHPSIHPKPSIHPHPSTAIHPSIHTRHMPLNQRRQTSWQPSWLALCLCQGAQGRISAGRNDGLMCPASGRVLSHGAEESGSSFKGTLGTCSALRFNQCYGCKGTSLASLGTGLKCRPGAGSVSSQESSRLCCSPTEGVAPSSPPDGMVLRDQKDWTFAEI